MESSRLAKGATRWSARGLLLCSGIQAGRSTRRRRGCRRKRATTVSVRLSQLPGHSDCNDARAVERGGTALYLYMKSLHVRDQKKNQSVQKSTRHSETVLKGRYALPVGPPCSQGPVTTGVALSRRGKTRRAGLRISRGRDIDLAFPFRTRTMGARVGVPATRAWRRKAPTGGVREPSEHGPRTAAQGGAVHATPDDQ